MEWQCTSEQYNIDLLVISINSNSFIRRKRGGGGEDRKRGGGGEDRKRGGGGEEEGRIERGEEGRIERGEEEGRRRGG